MADTQGAFRRIIGGSHFAAAYAAQFLLSLHLFFVLYIASAYLADLFGERTVSWLVAAGAVAAFIAIVFIAPSLAKRAYTFPRYIAWWAVGEVVCYAILALAEVLPASFSVLALTALAFIVTQATYLLGTYAMDLVFEAAIGDHEQVTGRVRTTALTLMNAALIVAAPLSPLVVSSWGYGAAYLIGAAALLPLLFIARHLPLPLASYHRNVLQTLRILLGHKPLRDAFVIQIGLRMFYAWMVVYTPLYLHSTLGMPWEQIGMLLFIALWPFVLFERIVGWLADTRWGEKEFIIAGFLTMAGSAALFPFLPPAGVTLWALALFMSRVGAAFVEAASESYFFKHADTDLADVVAFFRSTRPIAFFLSGAVAGVVVWHASIAASFLALAALLVLFGGYALTLRDTQPATAPTSART